jgi:DUF2075 family protein
VDYIGVIVGPDLIVSDGQVITQPEKRAGSDQSVKGWKKLAENDPEAARKMTDAIIKNTYRTLMTRGMKGCYLYCKDPELAGFLRSSLNSVRPPSPT